MNLLSQSCLVCCLLIGIAAAIPAGEKQSELLPKPEALTAEETKPIDEAQIAAEDSDGKELDRSKKSAATTFCVEIKPNPDTIYIQPPPPPPAFYGPPPTSPPAPTTQAPVQVTQPPAPPKQCHQKIVPLVYQPPSQILYIPTEDCGGNGGQQQSPLIIPGSSNGAGPGIATGVAGPSGLGGLGGLNLGSLGGNFGIAGPGISAQIGGGLGGLGGLNLNIDGLGGSAAPVPLGNLGNLKGGVLNDLNQQKLNLLSSLLNPGQSHLLNLLHPHNHNIACQCRARAMMTPETTIAAPSVSAQIPAPQPAPVTITHDQPAAQLGPVTITHSQPAPPSVSVSVQPAPSVPNQLPPVTVPASPAASVSVSSAASDAAQAVHDLIQHNVNEQLARLAQHQYFQSRNIPCPDGQPQASFVAQAAPVQVPAPAPAPAQVTISRTNVPQVTNPRTFPSPQGPIQVQAQVVGSPIQHPNPFSYQAYYLSPSGVQRTATNPDCNTHLVRFGRHPDAPGTVSKSVEEKAPQTAETTKVTSSILGQMPLSEQINKMKSEGQFISVPNSSLKAQRSADQSSDDESSESPAFKIVNKTVNKRDEDKVQDNELEQS